MHIRPYQPADADVLLYLFRETVRTVNRRDYTPLQIDAWASDAIDPHAWAQRFDGRHTFVAVNDGQPVGFAELEPNGHIDRMYVSAAHQRQGVGRALLAAVIDQARQIKRTTLHVEASITAQPFFMANGFSVIARQQVVCRGVVMPNVRMQRSLA